MSWRGEFSRALGEISLILFTVGGERYGADASQVLRVDRPRAETFRSSVLGTPKLGERALVFLSGREQESCEERSLAIDSVLGLRQVTISELRQKTFVLASAKAALGFWLDGERPVVLVDLPAAVP